MRVPLSWIREYVDTPLDADEIAHRLTMSGTEVGTVHRVGTQWDRVVIGRVESVERHQGADNLFVAEVDVGDGRLTLVTAADNVSAGDVAPVVRAGGRLSSQRVVEARRFRGVRSGGMLCSGEELGISPDGDHIYLLEPDAPVGVSLHDYLADEILDIELTPNRPDCLGVLGIAREVAALTGCALRELGFGGPGSGVGSQTDPWPPTTNPWPGLSHPVPVFVDDPDLCPRYTAAYIEGMRIALSPPWMQRRLYHCGVRAISNVVDVTNYVMLELGQPLHAFDADRLRQGTIRVRRARAGERLTTIDGVDRALPEGSLVIADAEVSVGLAGVMGGINSEIGEATTRVVLESATFDALSIRRTSRALRLTTEASKRFDKGLDPELPLVASRRALALFAELAGGRAADAIVDVAEPRPSPRRIVFALGDVAGLIGRQYTAEEIQAVLVPLGFGLELRAEGFQATVPSWRMDVEGKADVAEEIARISGYDAVPAVPPSGPLAPAHEDPALRWEAAVRSALAAAGLQEVITYSLVDPHAVGRLQPDQPSMNADPDPIPIANPMSIEHSRLRTTLLPSLLSTVAANLRYQERVAIFETARVFLPPLDPLPREERRLAIALAGRRAPGGWNADGRPFDFSDLRAAVEAAFRALHVEPRVTPHPNPPPHPPSRVAGGGRGNPSWHHPGRGASVRAEGHDADLGCLGQVHPRVAEHFDISDVEVYAAEIDLEALLPLAVEEIQVQPLPRYPAIRRDLAFIVQEQTTHEQVASAIRAAAGLLLESIVIFDVYRGAPVPPGHVSLAYSLSFRSSDRTLADDEVDAAITAIEKHVAARLGGGVRRNPNP